MADGWTPEQLLDAVRSVVSSVEAGDERVPVEVLFDGEDLLVTFSWPDQPHLFGIRSRPSASPEGQARARRASHRRNGRTRSLWC